jgi:hypothetical protein
MKPTEGKEVRVIASAIVLALLLQPLASAQQDTATSSSASQPSASQASEEQFPDSPGTVQSRPNSSPAAIPGSTRTDRNPSAETEAALLQQPEPQQSEPQQSEPANTSSAPASPSGDSSQSSTSTAQSQQQQQTPHEPLGTAAAESVQTTGVAASRPAGAAVAPAKQRRVRSILIKVGALVGAGVAIGTTMALSQGSPSKPPGAH